MDSPQQQRSAPPYKGIVFVLLAVLAILLTGSVLFLWEVGYFLPPMSETQVQRLIQQAGGADKISREASLLLNSDRHKNHDFHSLSIYDNRPEITNYPAISVLVTNSHTGSLVIEPGYEGLPPYIEDLPPHIRIMFGPHRHIKFMLIFNVTNGVGQQFRDSHLQLSSNIFFSK